ncbi:hypothetical protein HK098_005021 [Nowakowskiella sp. JEL0407]|nr:hypothetical protein HK098_005021 [Nowakowskiella sp. JEL0407]
MQPVPGVTAFPESDNLMKWVGTIDGPDGTPFAGFQYKVILKFPDEYPFKSPTVTFDRSTPCFHPNVGLEGTICLDILKDKWSAIYTVQTVLISLQSLLGEPNNLSPLNNEAANLWNNKPEFRKKVESTYKQIFNITMSIKVEMKAIQISDWVSNIRELKPTVVSDPVLTDNNVICDVRAMGINFFDSLMVKGLYQVKPKFPFIPGAEFAGIITHIGKNVKDFQIGDCVFGIDESGLNAFAEKISVVPTPYSLFKIPANLTFAEAASIPMIYPTSWVGLIHRGNLTKGEICLIHAASSGVGLAALHIAKHIGAIVIATASTPEKLSICKQNGADFVVNYTEKSYISQIQQIVRGLGRKGVDVVYDPVGKMEENLKCIAWGGRLLVVGFAGGNIEKVAVNKLLLKNASIVGVYYGQTRVHEPEILPIMFEWLFAMFKSVRPLLYAKNYVGLESIPEAIEDLVNRKAYGKVVVQIPEKTNKARL